MVIRAPQGFSADALAPFLGPLASHS
jgi:hypothetical protein